MPENSQSTDLRSRLDALKKRDYPFPLWAFLQLVHTAHPRDLVPYNLGIELLAEWLDPIQVPSAQEEEIYPQYFYLRYSPEIQRILGSQFNRFAQYYALKYKCDDSKFFR
jgi:hypothetical protein